MSSVYTESVIHDVSSGTAAYIASFAKSLASTRVAFAGTPSPGASLLDLFLNLFDTSDPYTPEEMDLLKSWCNWAGPGWAVVDLEDKGFTLHRFPLSFRASWPPPASWAAGRDWHPLTQENPRKTKRGTYRTRK